MQLCVLHKDISWSLISIICVTYKILHMDILSPFVGVRFVLICAWAGCIKELVVLVRVSLRFNVCDKNTFVCGSLTWSGVASSSNALQSNRQYF